MKLLSKTLLPLVLAGATLWAADPVSTAPAANRWSIADDGGIAWDIKPREVHKDHIEMSGRKVSVIVSYDLSRTGKLSIRRQVVWPMLRFKPNATRHHYSLTFGDDTAPRVVVGDNPAGDETTTRVHHKGVMTTEGILVRNRTTTVAFTRSIFPSVDKPVVIDATTYTNKSEQPVKIEIEPNERTTRTSAERGIYGAYLATAQVVGTGVKTLQPGESVSFAVILSARKEGEPAPQIDVTAELKARQDRVASLLDRMQLDTPSPLLDTAFAFAKIRAAESIYETKGGLMHSPGGGHYYAAIWANDQAEYANPFFAMLGDPTAVESAINSYRHFARFMNAEYKPIPSSIISEGANFWHGAKDRGDMAMIAYGASRFALAYGRKETAAELWPLIEWSLEYCKRKVTKDGVVASDSDELENRFPSGWANLCTSTLYYDALISSAALARDLGRPAAVSEDYLARAKAVRAAIESYFGAEVEGFHTYRYFDKSQPGAAARHAHYAEKPDILRAWICMPLTVGIYDRKEGTIAALFSPRLWTADGLATEAGQETFWDRSTLYALRGVFEAGATQRALDYLTYYSNRRLLGDHVPYPIEAWPENDQRHLSAESSLYCRIYTEGLFGVRPTGFRSFDLTPRLPQDWPSMALKRVRAFGGEFDLSVTREAGKLRIEVTRTGQPAITRTIAEGETLGVAL